MFWTSGGLRVSDFSTLPTGWLQQPHFAKCAWSWSLGTKQLYSAVMMYGNPCMVLLHDHKYCASLCVASPSARADAMHHSVTNKGTSVTHGGAIDPTAWPGPILSMGVGNKESNRLNRPLAQLAQIGAYTLS
jgi:hypothetical protein